MKIDHVALWTNKLEAMKDFYVEFFQGSANDKYLNLSKRFESYFISFQSGARLEIMHKPDIIGLKAEIDKSYAGFVHLAFSVGNKERVDELTAKLEKRGYPVISAPRTTGDGYYESCVLDPDGNKIEITA